MEFSTRHFIVEGEVQGVGYRRFAQDAAEQLSITGWVRNLADGRVEGLAQGDPKVLEKFEIELRKGPRLSRVQFVQTKAVELKERLRHFVIERDGDQSWQSD